MSRQWAPELAYSWPMIVFLLTFPFLGVLIATGAEWARIAAYACVVGAFVCCPIRDAILDRFWPDRP